MAHYLVVSGKEIQKSRHCPEFAEIKCKKRLVAEVEQTRRGCDVQNVQCLFPLCVMRERVMLNNYKSVSFHLFK